MSIVFPVTFFQNNSVTPSSKFAITECNNPEVILYTESPLGEYVETGAIIKVAEVCWNVQEIEAFPPGAEIIEIEEIEGEFPAGDEPPACNCCINGNTYEVNTCGGELAGIVDLTDLDVSIGDVIKLEESEDCYIVSTKVCTPADRVFFEKIECLVDPTECCESCGDEPPIEVPKLTIGDEQAEASNDWSCPSGECPFSEPPGTDLPYQVLSTDLDGWYWTSIQIAEDAPEGIPINEAFETEGFFEPFDALAGNGLLITDSSVNSYLPAFNFNGIGPLVPGAIYQVNIKQSSTINPAAYEGLEGKITIVE